MELIQHAEITDVAGQLTIEFSDIPQTYKDVVIRYSIRSTGGANFQSGSVFANTYGVGTYSRQQLQGTGTGTSANSTTTDSQVYVGAINADTSTANTYSTGEVYIANYASANAKTFLVQSVNESQAVLANQHWTAYHWDQTAAITSLSVAVYGKTNNLKQYSQASLYGIPAYASSTSPKATGGIISYDATNDYWVHTFTASGTFTPTENLTCEYLVIAGGGGAGSYGGGGGAGGYRSSVSGELSGGGASAESALSLTASTGYTVTIGAGGAGVQMATTNKGSDTTFHTITSEGGGAAGHYNGSSYASGGNGGSGGGGSYSIHTPGSGTANQGYDGGFGSGSGRSGGGGGGAGEVGTNAAGGYGDGGDGVQSSITGSPIYRAGGGGGSLESGSPAGVGGAGGGGDGGAGGVLGRNGAPGLGAGGGGAGTSSEGGSGGSGVVIVRYAA